MKKWHKGLVIGLAAVLLSTLGIQASDLIRGIESNMLGSVIDGTGPCGSGAIPLLLGGRTLCVDTYEASPGKDCPYQSIQNELQTKDNFAVTDCLPVSVPEAAPWSFVSLTDSQQLCARSGKRLPTNEEWYKAVSGLADQSKCVTDADNNTPAPTGSAGCISPLGTHDLIGNVWEWIDEEVTDGQYHERELPESGYVTSVDTDGVVVETSVSAESSFGDDYAWTNDSGVRAMIRGGFYGSGEDAGIFAQNISIPTNFKTGGVGFRCVKDI